MSSVPDAMMFCNPDHRRRTGSGRAPNRQGGGRRQRPRAAPHTPPADAAGRPKPEERQPKATATGRRESRARQREGQREDSQHAPPDGRAPLYPVPPPAGWITAVAGSSAAAGAIRAVSIAMP